jgi:hypothetical protein
MDRSLSMRGDEEEEAWWPESREILRMASKRGEGYMEDNSSCSTNRLTDLPLLCAVQDCLVGGGFNRGDLSYNDIRSVVERRVGANKGTKSFIGLLCS